MFQTIKKSRLVSAALLVVGVLAHAEELLIWQIPEKGKTPVFYQEASNKSKTITPFKPHQTVQVLSKQKDWAKISAMDNSGQIAWVLANEVKAATSLEIVLKQEANSYQCQVRIKDPEGREAGNWRLAHRLLDTNDKNKNSKGWRFGKKKPATKEEVWVNELDELQEAFAKQHAAMFNMMHRMFSGFIEEPSEKVHNVSETIHTEKTKTEEIRPLGDASTEEKAPVKEVKQEKVL